MSGKVIVHIGLGDYEVKSLAADCTDWGNAKMGKGEIRLNCRIIDLQIRATLLHEIFHIITYESGHPKESEDEGLMVALSNGWLQVLRDNPELIKALMEK